MPKIHYKHSKNPDGEWWIDDSGYASFADGDIGDKNHEIIAFESAIGLDEETCQQFDITPNGWDDEQLARDYLYEADIGLERGQNDRYSELTLKQALAIEDLNIKGLNFGLKEIVQFDDDGEIIEQDEESDDFREYELPTLDDVIEPLAKAWFEDKGANMEFFAWSEAHPNSDTRSYQMEVNNWIRVQGDYFQMGQFDDEALSRIRNAEIWNDEGLDDDGIPFEESEYEIHLEDFGNTQTGKRKDRSWTIQLKDLFNEAYNAETLKRISNGEDWAAPIPAPVIVPARTGQYTSGAVDNKWIYRTVGENPKDKDVILHFSHLVREKTVPTSDKRRRMTIYLVSYRGDDGLEYRKQFESYTEPQIPSSGLNSQITKMQKQW